MSRYIDADAAVKQFEEFHGNESRLLNCYNADWIISFIEGQPTACAQKVRHGKWELIEKNVSKCTVCGGLRNIETQFGWNFCPNCGAKMQYGDTENKGGE